MVGVFIFMEALFDADEVRLFDSKDAAHKWLRLELAIRDEIVPHDGGWKTGDRLFENWDDAFCEWQEGVGVLEFCHLFPVVDMRVAVNGN